MGTGTSVERFQGLYTSSGEVPWTSRKWRKEIAKAFEEQEECEGADQIIETWRICKFY